MWTPEKDNKLLKLWHSTQFFDMDNEDIEDYFETDFEDVQERLEWLLTSQDNKRTGLRRYEEFNEIDKIKQARLPKINESDVLDIILEAEQFGKRKSRRKK